MYPKELLCFQAVWQVLSTGVGPGDVGWACEARLSGSQVRQEWGEFVHYLVCMLFFENRTKASSLTGICFNSWEVKLLAYGSLRNNPSVLPVYPFLWKF